MAVVRSSLSKSGLATKGEKAERDRKLLVGFVTRPSSVLVGSSFK